MDIVSLELMLVPWLDYEKAHQKMAMCVENFGSYSGSGSQFKAEFVYSNIGKVTH